MHSLILKPFELHRLIDEYFTNIWSLGFPVQYQLKGTRIKLVFRGVEREYTVVLRKGFKDSTMIVSLTYTGFDYYDLARIDGPKVEYDYYNLPKYMGEVGGQLYAYEGLVWSERLHEAYFDNLQPLEKLPSHLTDIVEKVKFDIAKTINLYNVDVAVYTRLHVPEYAIAFEQCKKRIIVAWYNEISERAEGLIDEPQILLSAFRRCFEAKTAAY